MVCFASYNCRGINVLKYAFLDKLLQSSDFLFLQEHWLHTDDIPSLANFSSSSIFVHGCSGMQDGVLLNGRPYGGVAIVWHSRLNHTVSIYNHFSTRCCAVCVTLGRFKFALICVYFPTDNFSNSPSEELLDTIDCLETFIYSLDVDGIILGGDLNTDFLRDNAQSRCVSAFCERINIVPCITFVHPSLNYTRSHNDVSSFIDHFAVSNAFANTSYCTNYTVCDDSFMNEVNLSDHCGLCINIAIPPGIVPNIVQPQSKPSHSVLWHKASCDDINNFRALLEAKAYDILNTLSIDVRCCPGCNKIEHLSQIDNAAVNLHKALIDSSFAHIPRKRNITSKPTVAGWNAACADLRDQSLKWHHIWVDAGRPPTGVLANIMRSTRRQYHIASKRLLQSQKEQHNTRLAEAFAVPHSPSIFWKEVKRANAHTSHSFACNTVNGHTSPAEIANDFKDMYKNIFCAGLTSVDDLSNFRNNLNDLCVNEISQPFTPEEIASACKKLKPNKKDSDLLLMSNAIINAPPIVFSILCFIVNAIISHGHVPQQWLSGTIFPLLKSANLDKSQPSSYRPITLSSLFGKVLDLLILDRYYDYFYSCDLQFGFKKAHSTNHCTFVVKEVIDYYLHNDSDVYACTLDMQKAFDRVNIIKLFCKLLVRKLPVHIIRVLFLLYSQLSLTIFWNGNFSDIFVQLNGVKQGGILSPYLFCIFIDDMLTGLRNLRVGCFVGSIFFGCLAYADDVILLAPTLAALRIMLMFCTSFADSHDILFNSNKSHCIKFCNSLDIIQYDVKLQGGTLSWVNKVVHVGHVLISSNNDSDDIRQRIADFSSQVNYFIARFGHLPCVLKCKLFNNYCMSLYGCQLWKLSHKDLLSFDIVWRKSLRRLWHLPYRTHSALLPVFNNGRDLRNILYNRFISFSMQCLNSHNECISFIARVTSNSMLHNFGFNLYYAACQLNNTINIPSVAYVACELAFIRSGAFNCILTNGESLELLQQICSG